MKRLRGLRRRDFPIKRWMPFAVTLGPPLVALLIVVVNGGTPGDVLVAASVGAAAGALLETQRREQSERQANPRTTYTVETLENWRIDFRSRVQAARINDQLAKMTGARGTLPREVQAVLSLSNAELVIDDQREPWEAIKGRWDSADGRLVILGDPGYGKTVAALTLLDYINEVEGHGKPVADLFPLADWYRWHSEHPNDRLDQWLSQALFHAYPKFLSLDVAQTLVEHDLVIPILDGLDEIRSEDDRVACVDSIEQYASTNRPFIVTCRSVEYAALKRHFARPATPVVMAGLADSEVTTTLRRQAEASSYLEAEAWGTLADLHAAGHPTLVPLFESPLRLIAALAGYSRASDELTVREAEGPVVEIELTYDPRRLLEDDVAGAERRIWDQLLRTGRDLFHDADAAQIRRWLASIGRAIKLAGRQRFMLHELYLVVPDRDRSENVFRWTVSFVLGVVYGASATVMASLLVGVFVMAAIVLAVRVFTRSIPNVSGSLKLDARLQLLRRDAPGSVLVGVPAGLVMGWTNGWMMGLATGLAFTLSAVMIETLREGTRAIGEAGPPREFAGRELWAVLAASRKRGQFVGVVAGSFYGIGGGFITGVTSGVALQASVFVGVFLSAVFVGEVVLAMVGAAASAVAVGQLSGVVFGVYAGTAVALASGLRGGLSACLYHYWARVKLARRLSDVEFHTRDPGGATRYGPLELPLRLPEFMEWCAKPERGWLRVSDVCEFRHRELLDYLVPDEEESRAR